MTCGCSWPDALQQGCEVHGEIRGCACGQYHPVMPRFRLDEDIKLPAVCRTHLRHFPCAGCARDAERLAEVVLFGGPRHGRT